jgi:hypothetical protein
MGFPPIAETRVAQGFPLEITETNILCDFDLWPDLSMCEPLGHLLTQRRSGMTSRGGVIGRQRQLGRSWAVRARCERVVIESVGRRLAVAGIRQGGLLLALVEVERDVELRRADEQFLEASVVCERLPHLCRVVPELLFEPGDVLLVFSGGPHSL